MKIAKKVGVNLFVLVMVLAFYTVLLLETDKLWIQGVSLVLLIAVLVWGGRYQWKVGLASAVVFSAVMLYYSMREIPVWGARASGVCVGTDTVWGRDSGFADSLIFTVVCGKKCILEREGWYNKYIETITADSQIMDNIDHKVLSSETALSNGFVEAGWMHIDINFLLLSDEANARFEEGERVYLYINPIGLSEADTIAVWNDRKGNLYIESYE